MIDAETISFIGRILEIIGLVVLYFIIGFGPGFVVGILLMNRFPARDKPSRFEKSDNAIAQAGEHNRQWHPDDPRWKE